MNRKNVARLILRILVMGLIIFGITSAAHAAEIIDSGKMGVDGDNLMWTLDGLKVKTK